MKLFYKPESSSLFTHIVLLESKLDFKLEKVDLKSKKTERGTDYLSINPKGLVPALLLDDGTVLTEGVAIALYVADKVPHCNLIAPIGSMARYHTIEWLNYIAAELHKSFSPIFRRSTPETYKELIIEYLQVKFRYINLVLSEQNYLVANRFSIADAYLFTVMRWAQSLKLDMFRYPALAAYLEHIAERPSVVTALKVERLKG
ncbi:glutathione transferase GstA [Brenneria goodwinii]|uniref:Glutathione transferase GstA n=1 Tax=Brenneria goodwinii TaxID=1109412 RepID=A0AAE8JPK0_9GAMM|nr:glutathione transferase GstA [Brenneria goodwinii]ATA23792.1 glutathione S-transferase [Brenneria goodwinii]MCG8155733.1 glutathione transferase GstA [Brenneria goodwinii]MCG8160565.1 glutathione transferase GstA [Brenneria goodwinii]MCG8166333.1 glutathione transferase GstA [Brenneria goodwinii]MCG8171105.1 glutathione transferase GstA [Brenneria goodwinii]